MTVNVALTDDAAVEGGDLLGLYAGAVRAVSRAAGEATVHRSSLLHAVSRVQARVSCVIDVGKRT